jgi:hypothetical protein
LFFGLALLFAVFAILFLRRIRRSGRERATEPLAVPGQVLEEFAAELAPPPPYNREPPPGPVERELPQRYGVERLVLLARDPAWLFAYWEVSATRQDDFERAYGARTWEMTRPTLRVYDITGVDFDGGNALRIIDIGLQENADNWHIAVNDPDHSFVVDLGRMFPDGRFVTLLRSNVVQTPRAGFSDSTDEHWMWIEGLYRSMRIQLGTGSPLIIEEMASRAGEIPLNVSSPSFPGKEH